MAKKSSSRQFDWRSYSRPSRLLTDAQEAALSEGILRPLLDAVMAHPLMRLEIRSASASIYYRGASVLRLTGDGPFIAEFGSGSRLPIAAHADVQTCLETLTVESAAADADVAATGRNERSYEQAIACGNSGGDLWADELVIIDLEYTYGKRRYDLIGLHRREGVTGPGGFANARLAFIDLRVPGQSLTGGGGLAAVGADFAEFVKALGSEHLDRAKIEFEDLVQQKSRLGLLPAELDFRGFTEEFPELIAMFADLRIAEPSNDAAMTELHERLVARHFPTERLRFVDLPSVAEDGQGATVREGDVRDYRAFKSYRHAQRA